MRHGGIGQRVLVTARRQAHHEVQAGRHPLHAQPGKSGRQGRHQGVAAPSIDRAHLPQVPIEAVAFEEIGEGELIERRRAVVGVQLGERHPIHERRRQQQPADPEGRRQRLAGGPEVGDNAFRQALEGADGLAIEAVLGVVVVLDDDRPASRRPLEQRGPALGRENHPGRELVRGRDQHRADIEATEPVDAQAAAVHGYWSDAQAHGLDVGALAAVAGILHRHPAHAARTQHLADEPQALRVATAQHHAVRACDRASRAIDVGRKRRARPQRAVRIGVAQRVGARRVEHAAQRRQPRTTRKERDIRQARPEVVARGVHRPGADDVRGLVWTAHDDPRGGAPRRGEVALRDQLFVGEHRHTAGDAQIRGERARRRQHGTAGQPSRLDAGPQFGFDLPAQRRAAAAADRQQQFPGRSGPLQVALSGASDATTLSLGCRACR